MRITTVRILVQSILFGLFVAFCLVTTFSALNDCPALASRVGKFLEIDPLIAIATAITTHTIYRGLVWAILVVVLTLFLGRVFCSWICPFGAIHHFTGWLFNRRHTKARIESNQYRPMYAFKYCVLLFCLVAAFFSTLQIGLLDPICLLHRSVTTALLPALNTPPVMQKGWEPLGWSGFGEPKYHQLGWIIGFLALVLVSLNLAIPRFFCRALCPLGALLGLFSRFALWRIDRDPTRCNGCKLCERSCEGACDPCSRLRKSECLVCFNCIEDCPTGALRFAFLAAPAGEVPYPDVTARRAVLAAVAGALFYPFTRASGRTTRDFSSNVIRPPGTVEEQEFLERCVKCGQCMRVCPTNVIQPAAFESGVEGLWTPIMNFRMGYCQLNCTACGHVCPTGAIQRLTVAQKHGLAPLPDALGGRGPVRLGTAHYDLGRCLPWAKNIPCVVCEEVCPTSPKAIHCEYRRMLTRNGRKIVLSATPTTVTVADYPQAGEPIGQPCAFAPDQFRGDQTTAYFVEIAHRDGTSESHRIVSNGADTLVIGHLDEAAQARNDNRFARLPAPGAIAAILIELKVPRIDTSLCIGCGLCEKECPVVGDRRAVYVTAEGETRSQNYNDRDRNRSLRLMRNAARGN